jgi:glycosyltransferase involved in cell wall biosynthesis
MMTNVLHVVLSLTPGGSERITLEICKRAPSSVRPAVCCLDDPGPWAPELSMRGIPVAALHRKPGFRPWIGYQIARVAADHDAQVIHCHGYSSFVYGRIAACLRPGTRLIFTEQGRLSDKPPSRKRLIANSLLGRLPVRVCAVSGELREFMIAEGFPAGRIEVVHNAIDPGPAPTPHVRRQARTRLGLREDGWVVGTAARLDPVKNLTSLIDAFTTVCASQPQATLLIIGGGPEHDRLARAAGESGVASQISFTGHREDARALLPALDTYVNCSTTEGTSLTILEAMAAAVPVVATNVGGTPELVTSETGMLIPPRDSVALANALEALAREPARARRMGAAGRDRAVTHFGIARLVDRYSRMYHLESMGRES